MPEDTLNYTNGEMTVVWKPKVCIHSTLCWKGLIEVFNPKIRPWIKMNGAPAEKIIEQVKRCPSGALSYFRNNKVPDEHDKFTAESSTMLKVEVTVNGPYLIRSKRLILLRDGNEEIKTGTVALCRCGSSQNKPYCDGSHKKSEFKG